MFESEHVHSAVVGCDLGFVKELLTVIDESIQTGVQGLDLFQVLRHLFPQMFGAPEILQEITIILLCQLTHLAASLLQSIREPFRFSSQLVEIETGHGGKIIALT